VYAQERRIAVVFRPAAAASPLTVELTNPAAQHSLALPSLTLTGDRSGIGLSGYNTLLPGLAVRGLSLVPRYGDQKFAFDFQPSSLAGMGLTPRAVRGLMVTAKGRRVSGTLLAGRLVSGRPLGPFVSAVPRVLAFSATVKPLPNIAFSPRVVTPLSRQAPTAADPAMGLGMRAELSPHISVIGDIGTTRTGRRLSTHSGRRDAADGRRWAPSAIAGAFGRWSRVSFEASAFRADEGVTLLGSVPFAASDRKLASAHLLLVKGVTVDGQFSASNPVGRTAAGTATRSATLRLDRLPYAFLMVQFNRSTTRAQRPPDLMIEWRDKGKSGTTIQLEQRSDGSGSAAGNTRRLQLEVPKLQNGRRLVLSLRSSVFLSTPQPSQSRIATRLKGRLAAGPHLGLIGEADVDALGSRSARRLRSVTGGGEIALARATSMQLTYLYLPGGSLPRWKRIEIRFTRALSL
jgi:hypothetical protein